MLNSKPNLDDFADVLEVLAERYSQVEGQGERSADWVRSAITSADTKLGALRFILERSSPGSNPKLLDIGSQIGSLPLYATRLGIESTAIDNAELAQDCGRILREYGVDYRVGDIGKDHLPFADETFDFVTYMDVIEHHEYSPKHVLLEVWRVLAPGGCVIITTPNHASIYNRLSLLSGRSVNDPFGYFFETSADQPVYLGHHREYTRVELRTALGRTGFRVLQCSAIDEGLRPQLSDFRRARVHGWVPALREQGRYLAAGVLGHLWTALSLPFGRILWATGEKIDR
jgi:2-polyprenyl-3-methyl-5-hydroxy-6-metoxy-1,4-benzoquinol methylase